MKTLETNGFKQVKIFGGYYGKNSTVLFESFNNTKTVIKEYHGFSEEEILIYQEIQNQFKRILDGMYDVKGKNLSFYGRKITSIGIELLELPQDQIKLGCYNTNNRDLKQFKNFKSEEFPIIQIPYICGPDLGAIENDLFFKNQEPQKTYYKELKILIEEIKDIVNKKTGLSKQLFLENIKLQGIEDGALKITITDLCGDIKGIVKLVKNKIITPHTVQQ